MANASTACPSPKRGSGREEANDREPGGCGSGRVGKGRMGGIRNAATDPAGRGGFNPGRVDRYDVARLVIAAWADSLRSSSVYSPMSWPASRSPVDASGL